MTDIVLPETMEGMLELLIKAPSIESISIGVFSDHSLKTDQGFIITYIELYSSYDDFYTIKIEFFDDRITYLWIDYRLIDKNNLNKCAKYNVYSYTNFPTKVRLDLLEQLFFKFEDIWGKPLEHDLWDQLHMTKPLVD